MNIFHLAQIKAALRLEVAGLKHSRGSVYAMAKKKYGLTGNKQSVLNQVEKLLELELQKKEKDYVGN